MTRCNLTGTIFTGANLAGAQLLNAIACEDAYTQIEAAGGVVSEIRLAD
jgi:uncharacterized protein YjbI with pentapeptide repeats